jgi:purine-nucleoside phosphorylase
MTSDYRQTAEWLRQRLPVVPEIAIILGTGLNDLVDMSKVVLTMPYSEIPGFAASTAPSHKGNLILGEIKGTHILFLQGRFHFYEGHQISTVVFPVRVLASLGIKTLIVTNASGSLRENISPGAIVLLNDHINFMGLNPLVGENLEDLGERFPSMNSPYDSEYSFLIEKIAQDQNIQVRKGVYIAVSGPSLETRAECAAFAGWGADLVGMSTVPEVIVARHAGLRVLAISIVTNYSNLFHDQAHSQEEIRRNAAISGEKLKLILCEFISKQQEAH